MSEAQLRLDMGAKLPPSNDRGAFMFLSCPACRKPFDSAVQPGVNRFYEAYQELSKVERIVSFEVESEEGEGTK